jgi:hypothetical protein
MSRVARRERLESRNFTKTRVKRGMVPRRKISDHAVLFPELVRVCLRKSRWRPPADPARSRPPTALSTAIVNLNLLSGTERGRTPRAWKPLLLQLSGGAAELSVRKAVDVGDESGVHPSAEYRWRCQSGRTATAGIAERMTASPETEGPVPAAAVTTSLFAGPGLRTSRMAARAVCIDRPQNVWARSGGHESALSRRIAHR